MVKLEPEGLFDYEWKKQKIIRKKIKKNAVLSHLFQICEIETRTTLLDIFRIVSSYKTLKLVISQMASCYHIDEFHAQAEEPFTPDDKEKIDYLEIYHHPEISNNHEFDTSEGFGGVGPVTEEYKHHRSDGMIHYSVSYTPMNKLAHLPVILNKEFKIQAPFRRGQKEPKVIFEGTREFSLLEVLVAIYDDISFMGGPEDNAKFIEDMTERVAEAKEDIENGVKFKTLDEVMKNLGIERKPDIFPTDQDASLN